MTSILKETREKNGYTVEEVSEILKIRKQYIISLEEENFTNIPGDIYVKGYLKNYHEFLGLELPKINDSIDHNLKSDVDINIKKTTPTKKYIVAIICMLILIGVSYIYFNYIDNNDLNNSDSIKSNIIYNNENNETTFDQSY